MNKERLNSEQIKEICKIQHKIIVTKYFISKMPVAYTDMDVNKLESDMKIRSICEECEKEMIKLMKKYGNEIIENTFTDIEYLHREENRFTFEDQRKATKEVIDKELTLEEVMEKY